MTSEWQSDSCPWGKDNISRVPLSNKQQGSGCNNMSGQWVMEKQKKRTEVKGYFFFAAEMINSLRFSGKK